MSQIKTILNHFTKGSLLQGGFMFLLMKMGAMFFGYVNVWVISRFFGSEALGVFSFVLSVVTLTSIMAKAGTDMATVKFVSKYLATNQHGKIKHFYLQVCKIIIPGVIILSALLFFFNQFIAETIFSKPHYAYYLRIAAIMILPTAFTHINAEMHRAFKKIVQYAFLNLYSTFITLLILIAIIWLTGNTEKHIPISVHVLSSIFLFMLSFLLLFLLWRPLKKLKNDKVKIREITRTSFPMYHIAIAGTTILWADKLILGAFVSDAEIGIYHLMSRLALILSLVLLSGNTVLAPRFSELWELKKVDELKRVVAKASKTITLTTLPVFILLILFASEITLFFGPEFIAGTTVLCILAIAQFIDVWTGPVGIFLLMSGYERFNRNISILSTIVFLTSAYLGIKYFGITGAAYSVLLIYLFRNFLYVAFIYKKFRINFLYIPVITERTLKNQQNTETNE